MKAKDHLDRIQRFSEAGVLDALEYLLTVRAEAEQAANGEADLLERVRLAQEFALDLEKDTTEPTTPRIGTRLLEILGRPHHE